jgi:GDPmannose 4,6-dehydratase
VRDFVKLAFGEAGIEVEFSGTGQTEVGKVKACNNPAYQLEIGREVVSVDPRYFRPTEVDHLLGDPTKANTVLGWKPKYDLKGLVADMMQADLELFNRDKYVKEGGYKTMNYYEL